MLAGMPDVNVSPATAPGSKSKGAFRSNRRVERIVVESLSERADGLPIWVRCPARGPEKYSGFSRPKLYELAGKGLIRSVSIRQPGAVRGVRLFNLQSILAFVEKCEHESIQQ